MTHHPAGWLREHSPAPDWRDPVTGARLFEDESLVGKVAIKGAWVERDGAVAMILAPDGHQTRFDDEALRPDADITKAIT